MKKRILVVDDDAALARVLKDNLLFEGFEVECVSDGNQVLPRAKSFVPDLVVLDMRSTPLIDFRMTLARDLAEQLFIQMTLGDDRAVQATYVAGRLAHDRAAEGTTPCP